MRLNSQCEKFDGVHLFSSNVTYVLKNMLSDLNKKSSSICTQIMTRIAVRSEHVLH